MYELMEVTTIDSREVSEMMNIPHNDLLKKIRTNIKYLGEGNFSQSDYFKESTYFNEQHKEQPNYQITKKGCELLAHKMTGSKGVQFTAKYIEVFHKMESMLKNPTQSYMIQDPIERAKAWIKEQEEKQALEHQVKELEPARIFREAIGNSQDGILVRDLAKLLAQNGATLDGKTIGEKNLRIWLKENGYMNRNNMPSQKSIDLKIMRVIERPYYDPKINETKYKATTYIIGKGQTYFINKFLN